MPKHPLSVRPFLLELPSCTPRVAQHRPCAAPFPMEKEREWAGGNLSACTRPKARPGCPSDPQGPAGILLLKWECSDPESSFATSSSAQRLLFLCFRPFYFSWAVCELETNSLGQGKGITVSRVLSVWNSSGVACTGQHQCSKF